MTVQKKKTLKVFEPGMNRKRVFQRQLAHYTSHIGQIIYLAKMIRNEVWSTLSIPRASLRLSTIRSFLTKKVSVILQINVDPDLEI
jgi:tryptophan-rich sensory protein